MPKTTCKIRNWQIERAKARGSARLRRAALALYTPIDTSQIRADKAKAGAVTAAAGLPVHPALTGQMVAPHKYPITEIGGNGAVNTAVARLLDCNPAGGGILPTTETYMPTNRENLKPETPEIVPQGSIMAPYISTALLLGDDAEKTLRRQIAARVSPPVRAGLAWGAITHGIWTTNSYAPEKGETFIRWHGEIGFQKRDGSLGEATVAYLPKPVTADLLTAGVPVVHEGMLPSPMVATFSVECWCVPVRQEPGYGYEIRNRQGRRRNINALAPPEVQALLPQLPPPVVFEAEPAQLEYEYDAETGEISDAAPLVEAEAAE